MTLLQRWLVAVLLGVILVLGGAIVVGALSSGGKVRNPTTESALEENASVIARLKAKRDNLRKSGAKEQSVQERRGRRHEVSRRIPPASRGSNGTEAQHPSAAPGISSDLGASFDALEREISGEIGVAFAPLGSNSIEELGGTAVIHAWSSFKVPIVVTLLAEQEGQLSSEQEDLAASAITASDNEAAAALFSDLEQRTGGEAAGAIESVITQIPGGATEVATAPPPPGAYSSWGQTNWTLTAATAFYGAMACGEFGSVTNVLSDMEQVIPEQQWGLGQASFPSGANVAYKAGWGPDGSESGPYLVRQSGVVEGPRGEGFAVTMAAQDSDGSFESGVSDLDRVADWVAANVPLNGRC